MTRALRRLRPRRRHGALWRALAVDGSDGVLMLGRDGRIEYANEPVARLLGRRADALRGHRLPELVHGVTRGQGREEVLLRRAAGAPVWALLSTHPLEDGRTLVLVLDIDELKGSERLLQGTARRLGTIVEAQREIAESGSDLDAALQRLVERTAEAARADGARIYDLEGDELRARAACGTAAGAAGDTLPLAGSLAGVYVRSGALQTCPDVTRDPRAYTGPSTTRAAIYVPIARPDGMTSALAVLYATPAAFDDEDVEAARLMAQFAASALANAAALRARHALDGALADSEERFRAAIEASPTGFAVCGLDGAYLVVNDAFCRIVGRDRAQLDRLTWRELTHPDDVAADERLNERLLSGEVPYAQLEKRYLRPDGTVVTARLVVSLVRTDAGAPRFAVAQVQDVSEERRLERSLRERERFFHALFDQSLVAMNVFDDDARILEANERACRLARLPREQVIGRTLHEFSPEDLDFRPLLEEMLERGEAQGEVEMVNRDGERLTLVYLLRANVQPGRHVGLMLDVTEQRRLEERVRQGQKLEAVGQLAGGVAHDFNNMLTAINGYAELLLARLEPESGPHRHAREIQRAGLRAASLTRQLLAVGRRQVLAPEVLDLDAALERLLEPVRRLVGASVRVETSRTGAVEPVLVDETQLEQVVVALAANARDAMPSGGVLRIETETVTVDPEQAREAVATPGRYTRLRVVDTGVGMTAEQLERLWEPFYSTKGDAGAGLGLATVYGVVRQSGGFLAVESAPGAGATFDVHLPVTGRRERPVEEPPAGRASGTVLLVEDEAVVRAIATELLEEHGYRVLVARDGEEALALATREERIDLLVSDVVMPGLSGPDLARRLAAARPGLPTLFVSGYAADAMRDHGGLAPGALFLQKPFTAAALGQKLRELLDLQLAAGA